MNYLYALHQPDFMPWLGFFDKMNKVDNYIVFDNVYITTGKSWSNRVKILLNNKEYWLTIPISRSGISNKPIYEVELNQPERNFSKLLKTIRQAYLKHPFFKEVFPFIEELRLERELRLSEVNAKFNTKMYEKIFGRSKNILFASDVAGLRNIDKFKTDMIIKVCNNFDVENYLSGEGCLSFLETEQFRENGINISFQNFEPPVYPQYRNNESFVSGLSIIDALMNIGFEGTKQLLDRK